MTLWFTSDHHFGHGRICELAERPWPDVDAMNRALEDLWNDYVQPGDTVFYLGDFAMGTIADSLPTIGRLHGDVHLVPGNHDRPSSAYPHRNRVAERVADWTARYLDAGFATVLPGDVVPDLFDGRLVRLCHFPYSDDAEHHEGYADLLPYDDGLPLLHGHVHNQWRTNGRQFNVGVDVHTYVPVPSTLIEDWLDGLPSASAVDA